MEGLFGRIIGRLPSSHSKTPEAGKCGETMDGDELANLLSVVPGYRVLRAVDTEAGVDELRPADAGEIVVAVVDTETTGLDPKNDVMIEIAIQRFLADRDGRISQIERASSWVEDPGRPMPSGISRLTGLCDEDLSGRSFDDAAVSERIGTADIVVAHNAAFDRPLIDRRFPSVVDAAWACSLSQIDWRLLGFDGRALGHLLLQSGWYFEGHRAANDVRAVVTLLGSSTKDGRTVLAHLLERCERYGLRIDVVGAPFEARDALRNRGYRWDAARRFWSREIEPEDESLETDWLDRHVYQGRGKARLAAVSPRTRFKHDAAI